MDWLEKTIERAHKNAVKRDAYGKNPKDAIMDKLNEEVSEFEYALIKDFKADPWKYLGEMMLENNKEIFEKYMKDTYADELADIVIVCLAASKELGINLRFHIDEKIDYNEVR